jgi:glycosyltransferase involved in cell wall biosynthesis
MNTAKYAVFLPVRNGAEYIHGAISSVLAQVRKDWMLIVLDNQSEDETLEIAQRFNDPRIRIEQSSRSLSIWESWHRVWQMLHSGSIEAEYVGIIGHDDELCPTFLDAIDYLTVEQPDASIYQSAFDIIDGSGSLIRVSRPVPALESSSDFLASRLWGLRDSVGTGYIFRATDYISIGGIPNLPSLLHADDLLVTRLTSRSFKAACRDSHCRYRLHNASASRRLTMERLEAQIAAIDQYLELVRTESAEFMNSPAGQAALACFLAREIVILSPLCSTRLLGAAATRSIGSLTAAYMEAARGTDFRQWLGTNFVSRDLYPRFKQVQILSMLILDRFRRSR